MFSLFPLLNLSLATSLNLSSCQLFLLAYTRDLFNHHSLQLHASLKAWEVYQDLLTRKLNFNSVLWWKFKTWLKRKEYLDFYKTLSWESVREPLKHTSQEISMPVFRAPEHHTWKIKLKSPSPLNFSHDWITSSWNKADAQGSPFSSIGPCCNPSVPVTALKVFTA